MTSRSEKYGIFLALLSSFFYALSIPFSKILLEDIPSTMMAGLLYLGAGIGMGAISLFRKVKKTGNEHEKIKKKDFPYVMAMIILDIAAPISLLFGLNLTVAANASLLNNFEYAATALIAFLFFGEKISKRLWAGIIAVCFSCALLSFEAGSLEFSYGSVFVLLSAVLWGIENNCTKVLSEKDPLIIVLLKGIFCGGTSFVLAIIMGERASSVQSIGAALVLGLFSYGISIFVYIYAQRILGAARTGVYSAATPFIGTVISLIMFREIPGIRYLGALLFMIIGAWLSSADEPIFKKRKQ